MALSATLDGVPQEVLEHIAFFTATESFLGPPSILPLILANRKFHSWLSISRNYLLYGRIFVQKFDTGAVIRRLGPERATPEILAGELQRRWLNLNRIRARSYSITSPNECDDSAHRRQILFEAYFMIMENEGKNERQLREYANMDRWLREYWFHEGGASGAVECLREEKWLQDTQETSLAMWIFWFMLRPSDFRQDDETSIDAVITLKTMAIAAHKYALTDLPWTQFLPSRRLNSYSMLYYSKPCQVHLPPLGTPAILSFLTLANVLAVDGVRHSTPFPPSTAKGDIPRSLEWECELERCLDFGEEGHDLLPYTFRPGSIEGVWEGIFTYTEFMTYAQILSGGPLKSLQKSTVVQHRQTWKLREHHLIASDLTSSGSGIDHSSVNIEPLAAGGPLTAYFPPGTQITENRGGIDVYRSPQRDVLHYQRSIISTVDNRRSSVRDIIITGEGHSAWGQFNLVGRVRPCDGFISLVKEYVDGDRGKWLYRGYLVGNAFGRLAGRWRDTISPVDVDGYEGCFAMSRRG